MPTERPDYLQPAAPIPPTAAHSEPEPVKDPAPEPEPSIDDLQALCDQAIDLCQISQTYWQNGDVDSALQVLDQAYAALLKTTGKNSEAISQQKEDLRFMISKRIMEIYASRNLGANGTHTPIPRVMNAFVKAEIKRFTGPKRSFFAQSLKRSGQFRPYILKELKAAGLPEELAWLPLIESGFKTTALSKARALGIWQFIPSTGYKYGLKRDLLVDERLDPEKATRAAIAYLKELHQIFGDWFTALAAYNCGENRVLRIIRSQNINYLDGFWDLYSRLPRETAQYVPKFIATLHIVSDLGAYGFSEIQPDTPWSFDNVTVNRQVHLNGIASALHTDLRTLKNLNPELRYDILPDAEYRLRVPTGTKATLEQVIAAIPTSRPPQKSFRYHRVRSGEALSTIARKYRVSAASLARANNITRRNLIVAGQLLKIPGRTAAHTAHPIPPRQNPKTHTVRKGDSLWQLAKQYHTTVRRIQELNSLRSSALRVGQKLRIPSADIDAHTRYTVRQGDSPYSIAKAHNIPLKRLLRLNNLSKSSTIYPGQELHIK